VRALRRAALVPVVCLVVLVATAVPASAHAVLEGTSPTNGSTFSVADAPRSVKMHFGESVGAKLGAIRVYNDRGQLLDTGKPEHPGGDGSTVQASVPKLGTGTYVVTWRVISADTHPVEGAFTFRVGGSQRDVGSLTTRLLSSQAGSKTVGVLYGTLRFAEFAALLALIGAAGFLVLVWPDGRRLRRARRVLQYAWWALLIATVLAFAVEGIYAAAFPLRDLLKPDVLRDTWHTRYGEMAVLRAAILLAAIPFLRRLVGRRGHPPDDRALPGWCSWVGALFAIGLCLTVSLTGHAVTGRWHLLALPADVLHLLGGSLWLGGLVMLVAVALPLATPATLDRIVPRYSTLATVSVIAIVVSGVFQSIRQVGTLHALTSTSYGQILIVKLVAFTLVVILAALSRDVVRHWYRAPDDERLAIEEDFRADQIPPGPGGGRPSDSSGSGAVAVLEPPETSDTPAEWARSRLLRTAGLEIVLLIVVLVATALLVDARPGYEATTGPVNVTMKTSKMWFNVVIDPAKAGPNEVHLYALTPTGLPADPLQISMEMTNKDHNVGPLKVPLIRAAPGHELTQGFEIPFAGTWQVSVKALVTNLDEEDARQNVTIH
jgi:copper transport protein